MSLQKKVLDLKLNAALAARHAQFWQNAIDTQGEEKATAFYKHLGLNHLEEKQFAWEGLSLSRFPRQHEMMAVKGISTAQDNAKQQVEFILLKLRSELISDGLKGIKVLSPTDYHALTLRASADIRTRLRDRLITVHRQGRMLVASELGKKQAVDPEDDFEELDTITDVTTARVANDVQSRIVASAARYALLGLTGAALLNAIQGQLADGSVSYIDRTSTGAANKVINIGREDEAFRRRDEWSRVEYSALLDQNVCEPCASQDGQEAATEAELQPVPNPECLGGDWCRCFHVFVQD